MPSDTAILDTPLADALGERYLSYALSTIMSRSLPDVRDGLKPVHRRLLYAMLRLHLDPDTGFKKCARVVGDVIGKYHPHGDAAVYDALVRLAQSFAVRYPLVDGQGNFGNVDGDNAAAMRYTEARLTAVASALLQGIDEDAVDFRETYDGEESEPIVLPAAFPNLLANRATGIAVGMATSIPPHNAGELCDALLHLIKYPKATIAKLCELVPGPDFPTGGVLVESPDAIKEAYATGRGAFRVRARWEVEKLSQGRYQVVVTEIPWQVQKSRLVERVAALMEARKLPLVGDIRDESAEDIRLVIEPRSRGIEPEHLMAQLFQLTELEARIGFNMNVLDADQTPRVMNLREVLTAFLDHRHEVLKRVTKHRLARIENRLEVLGGYLAAYANLDLVIKIIREEDDPKAELMKALKITEVQAEAILNMRLRALRKLDEIEIRQEHADLTKEAKGLRALLRDEKKRWRVISDEIKEIREAFGPKTDLGRRRTEIGTPPAAVVIPIDIAVEKEPITVICSAKGWIRAFKGHLDPEAEVKYKDGDGPGFRLQAMSTDKLVLFATNGRFYTLGCDRLPPGRGNGEPVRLMVDLSNDHDIVSLRVHEAGRKLVVASSDGRGFIVAEDDVLAQTRTGKQVLNVRGDIEAQACVPLAGDHVAVIGENRKLLVFPTSDLPEMSRGRGVKLQSYRDGGLSDIKTFDLDDGLSWASGGRTRTETDLRAWIGKRAQAGRLPPKGFTRSNKFA
ncbi:MAG TPA: DNA topoisomerase IV subunit A [Alphaproteobacteria bacterium]|nr:DNA topoisomerase IV subunit A [Alphaproteobacteria bacterium]